MIEAIDLSQEQEVYDFLNREILKEPISDEELSVKLKEEFYFTKNEASRWLDKWSKRS
jgi:Arc/MetJ family transcription regulator